MIFENFSDMIATFSAKVTDFTVTPKGYQKFITNTRDFIDAFFLPIGKKILIGNTRRCV